MRIARSAISTWLALLALAIGCAELHPAVAQESWNPFKSQSERERDRRPRADDGATPSPPLPRERPTVPASEQPLPRPPARGGVERSELAPIMAPDTSGLPLELWRGLDLKTLEGLLAGLELPPRSPAIHQLWRRLLLSTATPPAGAPNDEHFVALRLEALYRSGLLEDMDAVLKDLPAPGPVVEMLRARRDIGLGQRETGCQTIKALAAPSSRLPGRLNRPVYARTVAIPIEGRLVQHGSADADELHGEWLLYPSYNTRLRFSGHQNRIMPPVGQPVFFVVNRFQTRK